MTATSTAAMAVGRLAATAVAGTAAASAVLLLCGRFFTNIPEYAYSTLVSGFIAEHVEYYIFRNTPVM